MELACLQKTLNILLLGETGVGKSTWINKFANSLTYHTLEQAEANDIVSLIPYSFTMKNENYTETLITTGSEKNENYATEGQSVTQRPKSYVFPLGRTEIRIIDTPGIGDTRGIEQDKANMQNIMTHLGNLDELNGIVILLKPTNARISVMFKFCIKELLTHLHRDACRNIVFCFTHARGTFFEPGDTLPALRKMLSDGGIDIRLGQDTIYCMDNEPIRFLAAVKQGISFNDERRQVYAKSWEKTVSETKRLLQYISSLEPHKVKNTLSLNDVRRLILELSRPLAEVSKAIEINIKLIEDKEKEISASTDHIEKLKGQLYIPQIDLETTPLGYPSTVCTHKDCCKQVQFGGQNKIDYCTRCHEHCSITGAPSDTLDCVALQHCAAMGPGPFYTCETCAHSWKIHMHVTYECRHVERQVVDDNIQKQIDKNTNSADIVKQHVEALKATAQELKVEKKRLTEVSAKFAHFLKINAIAAYNDALDDYLNHLIDVEKSVVQEGGDRRTLEGLMNMKAMYEQEKAALSEAMNVSDTRDSWLEPEAIQQLIQSLYDLKRSGDNLRKAMKVAEKANKTSTKYSEKRYELPSSNRKHCLAFTEQRGKE